MIPGVVRLGAAALIGAFVFWRTRRFDARGLVAFVAITVLIFFLQAQGWSPQWLAQIVPLILLCFPTRDGVTTVVLLSLVTFAEYPFLFIRTGDTGGTITGSLVLPFVTLVLARTAILIGVCVALYRRLRQEAVLALINVNRHVGAQRAAPLTNLAIFAYVCVFALIFSPMSRRDYLLFALVALIAAVVIVRLIQAPGYADAYYHFNAATRLASGQGLTDAYVWTYIGAPDRLPMPSHLYWMPLTSVIAGISMALFKRARRLRGRADSLHAAVRARRRWSASGSAGGSAGRAVTRGSPDC